MGRKMNEESAVKEKKQVISEEDLAVIEEIAARYNLTVQDFGSLLVKRNSAALRRVQVRLTTDELKLLNDKAKEKGMIRSKYCAMCIKKFMSEEYDGNINVLDMVREKENEQLREHRIPITFDSEKDYATAKRFASELGVKFPNVIRYCILNVAL